MSFNVEIRVGRLFETSIDGALTAEDVQALRTRVWALLAGHTGRVVGFSDMSRASLFEPDAARRLVEMFRHDSPKVERSAIYWGRNVSAFAVQTSKMIEQANQASAASGRPVDRRGFADAREAELWLGEVLDGEERARLHVLVR